MSENGEQLISTVASPEIEAKSAPLLPSLRLFTPASFLSFRGFFHYLTYESIIPKHENGTCLNVSYVVSKTTVCMSNNYINDRTKCFYNSSKTDKLSMFKL